jgi:hypothetical protein
MGGIGSGRYWLNKKVLTTDCRKLDVLELNRAGALKPGAIGNMSWTDDIDGHVSFSCETDSIHLSYHGHFFTNEITQDRHSIPLVWSACRYWRYCGGSINNKFRIKFHVIRNCTGLLPPMD